MNFKYENQGAVTYLVYTQEEGEALDEMTLSMLSNNHIQGIADTIVVQMNQKKQVKYNVTAKVPLTQYFSGKVNRGRLLAVFDGIVNALISVEDYMIDPAALLMDQNYVYADVSTGNAVMICLPTNDLGHRKMESLKFFKTILFDTKFDPAENTDYVTSLINYFNGVEEFNPYEFKTFLEKLRDEKQKRERMSVRNRSMENSQSACRQQGQAEDMPQQLRVQSSAQRVSQLWPNQQKQGMYQVSQNQQSVQVLQRQEADCLEGVPRAGEMKQQMSNATGMPPVQNRNGTISKQSGMEMSGGLEFPQSPGVQESNALNGEEISLFYLLQHYNKENAAQYKVQKELKKAEKEMKKRNKGKKKKEKNKKEVDTHPEMSMPRQDNRQVQREQPIMSYQQNSPVYGHIQQVYQDSSVSPQMIQRQPKAPAPKPEIQQQEEATVIDDFYESTVILDGNNIMDPNAGKPFLLRVKTGDRIPIGTDFFKIGKQRGYADYCITDNRSISRSHATIMVRDGRYFVVDTNSTNHTYVNGQMIQSNTEVEIDNGARIRLANEEFEFHTV